MEERRWKTATTLLKEMSSLTTLHIRIGRGYYHTGFSSSSSRRPVLGQTPENKVLTELIGIQARQSFVVEMAWSEEVRGELVEATFDLVVVDPYPESPLVNT